MREIKFRIWDKSNQSYVSYPSLFALRTDGLIVVAGTDKVLSPVSDNFIAEQFTGLRDKNGKEIYEGDIVKILIYREYLSSPNTKDKYKLEVAKNGCHCGLNTNGMISTKLEDEDDYKPQMEVIGNIHENAELLK